MTTESSRREKEQPLTVPDQMIGSWSGGKNSALALHAIGADQELDDAVLLTTLEETNRAGMQGARRVLRMLGYPLMEVDLPASYSDEVYEERMAELLRPYRQCGIHRVVFGDLVLADIRAYGEEKLAETGMTALFHCVGAGPAIWQIGPAVTCVDTNVLDETFAGSEYSGSILPQ